MAVALAVARRVAAVVEYVTRVIAPSEISARVLVSLLLAHTLAACYCGGCVNDITFVALSLLGVRP